MEAYIPGLYENGFDTALNATFRGNLTVEGTTNIAAVSLTDLTTTGNTTLGNAVTDTTAINGATTITSTSASALTVGRQGATAPVLKIDAATASVATGVSITGAAAGGGVAVAAISSGTDEALTINAKGTGTIGIGSVSTGAVTITPATTVTGNLTVGASKLVVTATSGNASTTGLVTTKNATAVPASAGAVAAGPGISMFSTNISVWVTSDAPAFSATKGDICINTGGSSSSTRLYINNGTTNWVAITTAS